MPTLNLIIAESCNLATNYTTATGCVDVGENYLYFTLSDAVTIHRVDLTGAMTTSAFFATLPYAVDADNPQALVQDPADSAYLIAITVEGIYRVAVSGGAVTLVLTLATWDAAAAAGGAISLVANCCFANPRNGKLLIGGNGGGSGQIMEVDTATGAITQFFRTGYFLSGAVVGPLSTDLLVVHRYYPTSAPVNIDMLTEQAQLLGSVGAGLIATNEVGALVKLSNDLYCIQGQSNVVAITPTTSTLASGSGMSGLTGYMPIKNRTIWRRANGFDFRS